MTKNAVWHVLNGFPNTTKPGSAAMLHLKGCPHTIWRGVEGHLTPATPQQEASTEKCRTCLNRQP
jgi:hypothetical protein